MPLARAHSVALVGVRATWSRSRPTSRTGCPRRSWSACPTPRCARPGTGSARRSSTAASSGRTKITVGLSPASLPKRGSASTWPSRSPSWPRRRGPAAAIAGEMFLAELGLDGRLRPVPGVLPAVAAAAHGYDRVVVAAQNAEEAELVPGVRVVGAASLTEVATGCAARRDAAGRRRIRPRREPAAPSADGTAASPLRPHAHRAAATPRPGRGARPVGRGAAAEVCAAGGHNLSLLGPPGAGKTMLAERLPTILPRAGPRGRARGHVDPLGGRARCRRRPADDRAAVLRPASHRDHGRDRRRRQRRDPPGAGSLAHRGRPVPRRGARVRQGRARRAAPAAGIGRGGRSPGRAPRRASRPGSPWSWRPTRARAPGRRGRRAAAPAARPPAAATWPGCPARCSTGWTSRSTSSRSAGGMLNDRNFAEPSRRGAAGRRRQGARRRPAAGHPLAAQRRGSRHRAAPLLPARAGRAGLLDRAMELGQISARGADKIIRVAWTLADLAGQPTGRVRPSSRSDCGWGCPGERRDSLGRPTSELLPAPP